MCAEENNNKNKTNLPHPFQVQFSCWETTKPMTLKFIDFSFVFINWFLKKNPVNKKKIA